MTKTMFVNKYLRYTRYVHSYHKYKPNEILATARSSATWYPLSRIESTFANLSKLLLRFSIKRRSNYTCYCKFLFRTSEHATRLNYHLNKFYILLYIKKNYFCFTFSFELSANRTQRLKFAIGNKTTNFVLLMSTSCLVIGHHVIRRR